MNKALPLLAALAALSGCGERKARPEADKTAAAEKADPSAPQIGSFGVDLAAIDASVDPGDDFYRYVNGGWLKSFRIPDQYSSYSAFTMLAERADARVKAIVSGSSGRGDDPVEKKIADFYDAFMDVEAIEAKGAEPLAADFAAIDALSTPEAVAGAFFDPAIGGPIAGFVDVDARRPDRYALYLTQGELGLPDRAYYLEDRFEDLRDRYRNAVASLLRLAGVADAGGAAARILGFETEIARMQWSAAKRESRELTYNPKTIEQLEVFAPAIPWRTAFPAAVEHGVILREDDAIGQTAAIIAATPAETLRDYLKFRLIDRNADVLPAAFSVARASFEKNEFGAVDEDRSARALAAIGRDFKDGVGRLFAAHHFPAESKAGVEAIAKNLRAALDESLAADTWMSEETKARAQGKLATFALKLGAPAQGRDYGALDIARDDAFGNAKRLRRFLWEADLARLGRPVDRARWASAPQTAAAAYNPFLNDVAVPAAILEAPFFDPKADAVVNYGAIGALLGHEMTHALDGEGRKTDGAGVLSDWWDEEDESLYTERMNALAAQMPGAEQGPASVETAADVGGLALAWRAYRRSLGGEPAPVIEGLTGDQRFFLAYAQMMKRAVRAGQAGEDIRNGAHLPAPMRVNAAVRNLDAWYGAFGVAPGHALWLDPDDRVDIW